MLEHEGWRVPGEHLAPSCYRRGVPLCLSLGSSGLAAPTPGSTFQVAPPPWLCPGLQIHWFSIINSCVTVLLLTGFLATILMRVLKNDFVKYSRDDEVG